MLASTFTKYAIQLKIPSGMYFYKRNDGSIDDFLWSENTNKACHTNTKPRSIKYKEVLLASKFHVRSEEWMQKIVDQWKEDWKRK